MGQNYFCDLCRKSLPTANSLTPVSIGTDKVAEMCITCSSSLRTGIKKQLAEAQASFSAAFGQINQQMPAEQAKNE